MKMKYLIALGSVLCLTTALQAGDRANALLRAADRYRNGWGSFVVYTKITDYKNNEQDDLGQFEVMIQGDDKSLVRFLNPDQKGQYLLMLQEKMWIYLPNTRRPIRVTPLQRLMGDASNGDVARTNFSRDYDAALTGTDTLDGRPCYKLELTATNNAATYRRVEYWITEENAQPVKAELYLASGKHYKSITYNEYTVVDGQRFLSKMTLFDRLRKNRHTVMEFARYEPKKIPTKYFNKNYLTQLK